MTNSSYHPQEEIVARGRLFELVHQVQPDGRNFEIARRAPGVRLIIADKTNRRVLLTKEFRNELNDWDYRLPGGKVFDSLEEYAAFRESGKDIAEFAENKAKEESVQEAGIEINNLTLVKKSVVGATVEWDLYYFEALDWSDAEGGQQLEPGEKIEVSDDNWFSYYEARDMILNESMREERSALTLYQWIQRQEEGDNYEI